MSDSESVIFPLQEVLILLTNECLFIRDVSNLTGQIQFDPSWTSTNVCSKCSIASNHSRHAASLHINLHRGMEASSSDGILCSICHQVLRHPAEHATYSIRIHLLATVHCAMLNELTESNDSELTTSIVDETALAILKQQGSWGITVVSWQWKFFLHI